MGRELLVFLFFFAFLLKKLGFDSEMLNGMKEMETNVSLELSHDEACEILNRCLLAVGDDTPMFRDVMRRLARAIEQAERDLEFVA